MIPKNIKQHLPPGLEDNSVELYYDRGLKCLTNGTRYTWRQFPQPIVDTIIQDMKDNHEAIPGLLEMGYRSSIGQFVKYTSCRFGGFDFGADITKDGKILNTEYFECGFRGTCRQEGKVCATIKVGDEHLTKQEINVLKKVAASKANKVIAAELFISVETVSSHNQNIQRKLGVFTKIEMANWAIKRNIVEPK